MSHESGAAAEYRKELIRLGQQSQESFDKTLLTLSTGAIAVSLAFGGNVLGALPWTASGWLVTAWSLWSLCIAATLASFWTSMRATHCAILDLDGGSPPGTSARRYDWLTKCLGILAPVSFVVGVATFLNFALQNIGG